MTLKLSFHGKLITLIALTLASWCSLSPALAQDTIPAGSGFVGGDIGIGISNNSQGTNLTLGGMGGYRILPNLTGAIFVNYMSLGTISNPTLSLNGSSQSITYYGIEGDYPLPFLMDSLHIGAKLGLASSSINATSSGLTNGSINNAHVFIGPKVGYDFAMPNTHFSLGGEANLLFKTTSTEPLASFSTINGVSTLFNVLGIIKFWF